MSGTARPAWLVAAPLLFVSLWSGGFTAIKLCLPHVEPLTLQVLRYAVVVGLLGPLWLIRRPARPSRAVLLHLVRMGLLVQFAYFASMNLAMANGMGAGTIALLIGLQPVVVALLAPRVIGDPPVGRRGWIGLLLGMTGAGLVIVSGSGLAASGWAGLFFAMTALAVMTGGALLERKAAKGTDGGTDLVTANLVMCAVALAATLPLAAALETMRVELAPGFFVGLAYLVFVNSLISLSLLFAMLRHGEAARASSVFFLVPPLAGLIAWGVLGDVMAPLAMAGTAVAAFGVALVVWKR
ncbi:DMT family transporter [Roseococcus sp. SYP-B2431]|uniref:DMT family transporter n=1 Tax=Roseococcus sp. SYP-B2431 TaxID=2496640 RepID=UPI00197DDEF9|nr:DMT family transporter [Roseococcus sp. SYP-B2431]